MVKYVKTYIVILGTVDLNQYNSFTPNRLNQLQTKGVLKIAAKTSTSKSKLRKNRYCGGWQRSDAHRASTLTPSSTCNHPAVWALLAVAITSENHHFLPFLLFPRSLSAESRHSAHFRAAIAIHSARFIAHKTGPCPVQVVDGRTGKTRCRVPRALLVRHCRARRRVLVTPTPSGKGREVWNRGQTAIVRGQWHRALTR